MNRRRLVLGAASGLVMAGAGRAIAAAIPSPAYSESAMALVFNADAGRMLSLRLGRLLGQGETTVWAGFESDAVAYSLADRAGLPRTALPTDVAQPVAAFDSGGPWGCRLERRGRWGPRMTGEGRMDGRMQIGADPTEGPGAVPARIEVAFEASHTPVAIREGRMEVFGRGKGRIVLPDRVLEVDGFAKWHEQVGDRPRFAPAFTYVALSGAMGSLLAISRAGGVSGFALTDGRTTPVATFEVGAPAAERRFRATLQDGRTIEGAARTVRTSSEPIEGQRRPSATVVAETTLGRLAGQINDWRPEE